MNLTQHMEKTLCGKPTKNGGACRMPLRSGKCLIHNSDLRKRNKAVARSFRKRDPAAFLAQRSRAGALGYKATGESKGWAVANRAAAAWRRKHPTEPERWMIGVLKKYGIAFERERVMDERGYAIDFVVADRLAIEVNGHQSKPSFGEGEPRISRTNAKIAFLNQLGYSVIVVNALDDRAHEERRLLEFISMHLV